MVKVREDYAMTGDGQVDIEGWVRQIASQTHLEDPEQFRQACEATCSAERSEEFCSFYCVCVLDAVER